MGNRRLFDDTVKQFRVVFHGSTSAIWKPEITKIGYTKDFGYGFYVTEIQTQAEHKTKTDVGVVSIYEFYYKRL